MTIKKTLLLSLSIFSSIFFSQSNAVIGSGMYTSGSNDYSAPIYRSSATSQYNYSKSVQLLTVNDLNNANIYNGYMINSIGYYKTTDANVNGSNEWTLKVYLKNSSVNSLNSGIAWDTMISGATLFHVSTINSTSNLPSSAGWITFANNTGNSFNYMGGAIEVYIDWAPSSTLQSPYSTGIFRWKYDLTSNIQAMGTSYSINIPGTETYYTTGAKRFQTQINYTSSVCSANPNPGNTISSYTPGCPGPYNTTLSLQNLSSGSGISYQWYNDGVAISGANNSTLNLTVTNAGTYYCNVTCVTSGISINSNPIYLPAPLPGITSLPWTENFDTLSTTGAGIIPPCWTQVTGTKPWASMNTASVTYNSPNSIPNYMSIAYNNTNASQLWTPPFLLTAGKAYEFSFYYNTNNDKGFTGNIKTNTSKSIIGATQLGTFITAAQATPGYIQYKVIFTPLITQNYYFAVDVSSTNEPWYLGLDDFKLQVDPVALAVSESSCLSCKVDIYPNPFTEVINISGVQNIKSIIITDVTGKILKNIKDIKNTIYLENLNSGIYIIILELKNGIKQSIKVLKK